MAKMKTGKKESSKSEKDAMPSFIKGKMPKKGK